MWENCDCCNLEGECTQLDFNNDWLCNDCYNHAIKLLGQIKNKERTRKTKR